MRFWLTQHVQERYIERILNGLNTTDNLMSTIIRQVSSGQDITSKVYDECPRYILFLYEKYKELGLTIIKNKDILFITKKRKGAYSLYDVVTCYLEDGHYLSQFKNTTLSRENIYLRIKEIKRNLK